MMVKLLLPAVAAALLLVGCGSSNSASASTPTASEKPWQDLKAKMERMTPEQRAQYIKDHPQEFENLGRIDAPPSSPPTQ